MSAGCSCTRINVLSDPAGWDPIPQVPRQLGSVEALVYGGDAAGAVRRVRDKLSVYMGFTEGGWSGPSYEVGAEVAIDMDIDIDQVMEPLGGLREAGVGEPD